MPIEFDCPRCHHRLRTPDGSEGRAALCPQCDQQVTVPAASEAAGEGSAGATPFAETTPSQPEPAGASFNPYAAPSVSAQAPPTAETLSDLSYRSVSVGEILSTTWRVFRDNLTHFLLLGLILIAMYIGGSVVSAPLSFISGVAASQENTILLILVNVLSVVWGQIYGSFCLAVGIKYALEVMAGNNEPFNSAFKVWSVFLRVLFAQIICALLASAGAGLCFIPIIPFVLAADRSPEIMIPAIIGFGIIAFIVYMVIFTRICITIPFIVEREQGVGEAITNSMTYTKGNSMAIIGAFLVIWVAMVPFMLFTCFLGSVLALPYGILLIVVIYRLTTGQQIKGNQNPFATTAPA